MVPTAYLLIIEYCRRSKVPRFGKVQNESSGAWRACHLFILLLFEDTPKASCSCYVHWLIYCNDYITVSKY